MSPHNRNVPGLLPVDGYCDKTDDTPSDCSRDKKGALQISKWDNAQAVVDECLQQCSQCARCRYISVSHAWRDCSWYHSCDALKTDVKGFRTFRLPPGNGTGHRRSRASSSRQSTPAHVHRHALRIQPEGVGWPWLQPAEAARVAIVLFGKIGSLQLASSAMRPDSGDVYVVRLAHDSLRRHVIVANANAATCDVYAHSWNPSLGLLIDRLYQPVWSEHARERRGLSKVQSVTASLAAALRAKRAHEQQLGKAYDLVLVQRHDTILYRPLIFADLQRAQLWLVGSCCPADESQFGLPGELPKLQSARASAKRACLGDEGAVVDHVCPTSRYLRMGNGDAEMHTEAEYNYYVNDWLLLAPSGTADTFGQLSERHEAYREALREVGVTTEWLHFYWAAHVHHALHVASGVRRALEAGLDVSLARLATSGRSCRANRTVAELLPPLRTPVWGGMQRVLCPHPGRIRCDWESHACSALALEGRPAEFPDLVRADL